MAEVKRNISYLNKDFSEFRNQLINYSQTYFPNTYTDFSPTSPGMMIIEQASYVGDVLSFYLDNQIQETFLQYARQSNNIYELAYMFGYKPKLISTSQTVLDLYQEVPAILVGGEYKPDFSFALTLKENSVFSGESGNEVIIQDFVDFSFSSSYDPTTITVSQTTGGNPTYYQLKKSVNAVSATIKSETFTFGQPTPFQTKTINGGDVIDILDIVDSEGNVWTEVDCLGQETVFDSIKNTNPNDPNSGKDVPYLLRLKKVPNRFTSRVIGNNTTQIQFGVGSPNDTEEIIIPNPNNVGIGLPIKKDKLTTAFSPTNFLYTGTYGVSPSNTTITVRYIVGGGVTSNFPANTISSLQNINSLKFKNFGLPSSTADFVFKSFQVTNPSPATGGKGGDTLEEIRQNTMMMAQAQQRAVTPNDYLIRALSMPSNFGSVSKAHIELPQIKDNQVSTIETLNLFVLTKNQNRQLDYAGDTLKSNLRTYLSQYRMIGDNIEIRDAFIINIGIDFEITVLPKNNNNEVLARCVRRLQNAFEIDNFQLNQPIILGNLYVLLDNITGVQTVKNIKIYNIAGENSGYSKFSYDISIATHNEVIYPSLDPSIFEIKYPNTDIKGRVVSL